MMKSLLCKLSVSFLFPNRSNEPRYRRSRLAYRALRGIGVSKDILVMTRAEVERKANVTSSLVYQVLHQGKILYG